MHIVLCLLPSGHLFSVTTPKGKTLSHLQPSLQSRKKKQLIKLCTEQDENGTFSLDLGAGVCEACLLHLQILLPSPAAQWGPLPAGQLGRPGVWHTHPTHAPATGNGPGHMRCSEASGTGWRVTGKPHQGPAPPPWGTACRLDPAFRS